MTARASLPAAAYGRAFEKLSIGYYLCGSFASGLHGLYRASADSDFVAEFSEYRVPLLAAELAPDFDADEEMMVRPFPFIVRSTSSTTRRCGRSTSSC